MRTHPLTRFTEHSITDPHQFLARIEEVVLAGISIDHEEYLDGVNAVSAPIYGSGSTLVAFLWIVGFTTRFKNEVLDQAAQHLRIEAETISKALGSRT